jgi:TPR repeat protein
MVEPAPGTRISVQPVMALAASIPSPAPSEKLLHTMLRRGDAALALGDVAAARMLYEGAANAGSAEAALDLGRTYDPHFLGTVEAHGIVANEDIAAGWYRRAAELGDARGRELMAGAEGRKAP